jgi:hypothetical protein
MVPEQILFRPPHLSPSHIHRSFPGHPTKTINLGFTVVQFKETWENECDPFLVFKFFFSSRKILLVYTAKIAEILDSLADTAKNKTTSIKLFVYLIS